MLQIQLYTAHQILYGGFPSYFEKVRDVQTYNTRTSVTNLNLYRFMSRNSEVPYGVYLIWHGKKKKVWNSFLEFFKAILIQ